MEQQTIEAVTSPAPVMEASRGAVVDLTPEQRTDWRKTGELPTTAKQETPIKEDAAPSNDENPPVEGTPSGDEKPTVEAKKPQEKSKPYARPDAEQRIKQLTDRIKQLETAQKPAQVEAPPPVQPKQEAPQTRQKPTAEDKDGDKPKYATYEDFVEDLADWKAEQRIAAQQREQQQQAQQREFKARVDEAKSRYGAEKFEEILAPAVNAIIGDQSVSGVVKTMLNESEVLPDLMYTIGSDPKELASFLEMAKSNPGKALRYIALTESLIRDELDGNKESKEVIPPVKPQTQAPKPPSEVGGRAASPGDPLEAAAKAGDFRSFKAEATRRQLAKMKG